MNENIWHRFWGGSYNQIVDFIRLNILLYSATMTNLFDFLIALMWLTNLGDGFIYYINQFRGFHLQ